MECLIINISDDEYMCGGNMLLKPEFGEQELIKPDSSGSQFIEDQSPQVKNEFILGGFALPPSSSSVEDYVESSGNELEDEVVTISDDEDAPPDTPSTDGISSIVISNVETIVECAPPSLFDSVGEAAKPEALFPISVNTFGLQSVNEDETSKILSVSNDGSREPESPELPNQGTLPISRTTLSLHSVSEEVPSTSNEVLKELGSGKLPKQDKVIFKCNICEFSANTRFSLVRHQMRRSHGEKRNDDEINDQVEYDQNPMSSLPENNKSSTSSSQKNDKNDGVPLMHSKTSHVTLSPWGKKKKKTANSLHNRKTRSLLVKKGSDILLPQKKNIIGSLEKSSQNTRKHLLRSNIDKETSSDRKENANQIVKPTQKNRERVQLRLKNVEITPSQKNNGDSIVKSTRDNETRLLRFKNVDDAPPSQEKNNGTIPVKSTNTNRILVCGKNDDVCSQIKNDKESGSSRNKSNILDNQMTGRNKDIPKLKVFNCKLCSFSCKIRFALKRHILAHTQKPEISNPNPSKFKCTYCSYDGNSKKSIFFHLLNAHKANNMKCTVCKKLVPEYFKKEHLIKCRKSKPNLKCDQCQYETSKRRELFWHRRKCGNEIMTAKKESPRKKKIEKNEPSAENSFICKFCSYSTSVERSLRLHLKLHTVHNRPILQCKLCDYRSTKHNIWAHTKTCHRADSVSNINKVHDAKEPKIKLHHKLRTVKSNTRRVFNCNFCSYASTTSRSLQEHLRVHTIHNTPIHSCSECDFKSTLRVLLRHVKTAHAHTKKSLVFLCKFCSFSAKSNRILQEHIKLHTELKNTIYQCNKCDYRSSKRNFTLHLKNKHALDVKIKSDPEIIRFPPKANKDHSSFNKTNLGRDIHDKKTDKHFARVLPAVKDEPELSNKIGIVQTVLNQNKGVSSDSFTGNFLFVCEICDYVTKWKEVLINHKSTHSSVTIPHRKETKPVVKKEIVNSKKTLGLDKNVSKRESVIICRVCKRHLSDNRGLKLHICAKSTDQYSVEVNGRIVIYQCRRCSYKTTLRYHISKHCNTVKHAMKVLYKCSFCGFLANCKAKLNLHKRMRHSKREEKQESHPWGSDRHNSNYYSIDQERENTTDVMYKCDTCDFQTNFEDNLHNHQILHININELRVYKNKTYNVGSGK